jgi:hypothetical protein
MWGCPNIGHAATHSPEERALQRAWLFFKTRTALERRPKPSRGCTQQHEYKMHLGYQPWKNEDFIRPWKERPCGQNMIEF